MKRIAITFMGFALALSSQAAAMNWGTGTLIKAPKSATDGAFGTANAGAGTLSLYVWIVDEAAYNAATYESISKMNIANANASVTGKSGSTGATASWTYSSSDYSTTANTTIYGLILATYKSGDIDMYIANKATGSINTAGSVTVNPTNLAKYEGGIKSGTAITGWTSSSTSPVPEPTSGLLLLLGFAGLALRRKCA